MDTVEKLFAPAKRALLLETAPCKIPTIALYVVIIMAKPLGVEFSMVDWKLST